MKFLDIFKKMNFKSKKFKIVSSCVCIVALLTVVAILVASMYIPATIKGSLFSKSALAATVNGSLKDDARAPEGMKLVCENAILALFYDETESQMAVFDKANGKYWHANPEHPENICYTHAGLKIRFLYTAHSGREQKVRGFN